MSLPSNWKFRTTHRSRQSLHQMGNKSKDVQPLAEHNSAAGFCCLVPRRAAALEVFSGQLRFADFGRTFRKGDCNGPEAPVSHASRLLRDDRRGVPEKSARHALRHYPIPAGGPCLHACVFDRPVYKSQTRAWTKTWVVVADWISTRYSRPRVTLKNRRIEI
jgi:hypothetical protein